MVRTYVHTIIVINHQFQHIWIVENTCDDNLRAQLESVKSSLENETIELQSKRTHEVSVREIPIVM